MGDKQCIHYWIVDSNAVRKKHKAKVSFYLEEYRLRMSFALFC